MRLRTIETFNLTNGLKKKGRKIKKAQRERYEAFLKFLKREKWEFVWDDLRNKFFSKNVDGKYEKFNVNLYLHKIRKGFGQMNKEYFIECIMCPEVSEYVHPLKDWFAHLDFDPKKDYIKEICSYIELVNDSNPEKMRLENCLKKWFVGAVKTLFDDYYVHKPAIILTGESGLGKTPFIECLLPKELNEFKNSMRSTPINTKDGLIALSNTFLMTLDEIDDLFKDNGLVKAYKAASTIAWVNVRIPYTNAPKLSKRISSFFGSCNRSTFLTDPTGSQRFNIFKVAGLRNNRDFPIERLWAQAYRLFLDGFNPELTKEELRLNEKANELFKTFGCEYELCAKHVEKVSEGSGKFVTATQIKIEIEKFYLVHLNLSREKIGVALGQMGFNRCAKRVGGTPTYGYYVLFKNLIHDE